jgi:predicted enzyme related to lactoylglutathione lyase
MHQNKNHIMIKLTNAFSSFSVDNIQKAKEFYSMLPGVDAKERNGMLELNTGNNKVMVYPKPNHEPATFTVLNFPVQNLEEAVDYLTQKGIKFEQYGGDIKTDSKGIARNEMTDIAWFKDPAGNILSVLVSKM